MQATVRIPRATATGVVVRYATAQDAQECARIFYDAFESIAVRHNLPIEPGSRDFADFKVADMISHEDDFTGLVAELDGEIVGSAFVDERSVVDGIGPVTVAPGAQDQGVGGELMRAALQRATERGTVGVRLVQTAYHYRSLALYAKLGFTIREPLSVLQGPPPPVRTPGRGVRPATDADIGTCDELCVRIQGHDRSRELRDAIAAGTARVVERPGGVSGYATGLGYGWHAVAEANEDLVALLGSADAFMGLGIIVPSRNAPLLQWCLDHGLRVVQQSTLMTMGLYNEPAGPYLPSILY